MFVFNQGGSDLRTFIDLFGICFSARVLIFSVTIMAYVSMLLLFNADQSVCTKSFENAS